MYDEYDFEHKNTTNDLLGRGRRSIVGVETGVFLCDLFTEFVLFAVDDCGAFATVLPERT